MRCKPSETKCGRRVTWGDSFTAKMVNVPKTRRTFCKKCGKHQPHKVTQYTKGKDPITPRGNGAMIGSRVATVGRQSRFPGRRLKPQRRLCCGLNVLSPTADPRGRWPLRDANILNWEEIRERAK